METNEAKNVGKLVKYQSTFDTLMSKYKKEKVDSVNWPLKEECLSPKQEEPPKQIVVSKKSLLKFSNKLLHVFLFGVPQCSLQHTECGGPMECGCHILRRHLCINKGGENLLVMTHDISYSAN
jgi:hypothetical protein